MIAPYVADFLKLLKSKNNRLVWGGMTALATIAAIKAEVIYENIDQIYAMMQVGSVITIDNGIKALALVAAKNNEYNKRIFPFLLDHLKTCRPREIPQHAEKAMAAVNCSNKDQFLTVLHERENDLTAPQIVRLKRIYKAVAKLGTVS